MAKIYKQLTPGIYLIRNIENNKIYIGSTKHLEKRRDEHYSALYNKKHANIKLQASYDIHGPTKFTFEILEILVESKEEPKRNLQRIEQRYLDLLDPYGERGFNICKDATGGSNITFHPNREEILRKKSISMKNKNPMKGISLYNKFIEKYGKKLADERWEKIRQNRVISSTGSRNGFFGKHPTTIKCEYCCREIPKSTYNQYHGDKCRTKPGNENIVRSVKRKLCQYCGKNIPVTVYQRFHGEQCRDKAGNENLVRILEKKLCLNCGRMICVVAFERHHGDNCRSLPQNKNIIIKYKPQKKFQCPYCKGYFSISNLKQFHNEMCRHKPGNENIEYNTEGISGVLTCSYCNKSATIGNYYRWHGEACKHKPGNENVKFNDKKIKCNYCGAISFGVNHYQYHGENCKSKPGNEGKIFVGRSKGIKIKKVTCEHCGIMMAINAYKRYHGNNCKFKIGETNV